MTEINLFSYLAATKTLHVRRMPAIDYGTEVLATHRFLAGDAPLTAGVLAVLGHRPTLFSNNIADDHRGGQIRAHLASWAVEHLPAPAPAALTRLNTVITDQAGNRTWYSGLAGIEPEFAGISPATFAAAPVAYIDSYQILSRPARRLMTAALRAGRQVMLNLGGAPAPAWLTSRGRGARLSVLQSSAREGRRSAARSLASQFYDAEVADLVVVTCGRSGAIAMTAEGTRIIVPAPRVTAVQTQGAGAVFSAALIHGMLQGQVAGDALSYACGLASRWCGYPAASPLADTITGCEPTL
jgi:sugar/nucleoside kinase (ribokinase family)